MKRSASAKDQLEDFANEAYPTILFSKHIFGMTPAFEIDQCGLVKIGYFINTVLLQGSSN